MTDVPEWEATVQEAAVQLEETLKQLHQEWEEIGYDEQARAMYRSQASNHIKDLLSEMIWESQQSKKGLLENVKRLMERAAVLNQELGLCPTLTEYELLPLTDLVHALKTDVEKLECKKEKRLTELRELLAKEKNICKALGTLPIGIKNHLPTEEELDGFKLYIQKQEAEKDRLESIFSDMRQSIIKMMDELGVLPSLNFEHIVYEDPENLVFSSENMCKLRALRDQLKSQVDEAKQCVEEMKEELIAMWKYLEEPEHVLVSFLDSCIGYSNATINALSSELKRCKEKRKQNIAKYVHQVREALVDLWDLCKYSEEQRKQFAAFNSHTYTEDLLILHELEIERLRKFYNNNKTIFELAEEREHLWKKMQELLKRANNPDRFYNRGGQLLMEEKERKTIQKKLPKIEEELRSLIQDYNNSHDEAFTINGMSVEEVLKESWENLNEEKETIKKARKEAKDKSAKKITPNATRKTPTALSVHRTPLYTSKRKLFSPSPNTPARRKNLTVVKTASKIRRSGRVLKKIQGSASKTIKIDDEKENELLQSTDAIDSTYSKFREHLEERVELCSSLLPEQVLINANMPKFKTPMKTPAKPLRKKMFSATPNIAGTSKQTHLRSNQKASRSPR